MLLDLFLIQYSSSKSVASPAFNRIVKFCTFADTNPKVLVLMPFNSSLLFIGILCIEQNL